MEPTEVAAPRDLRPNEATRPQEFLTALAATAVALGVPAALGAGHARPRAGLLLHRRHRRAAGTTLTIAPGSLPVTPKVSIRRTSVREGSLGRTVVQVPVRLGAPSSTPVRVAWHTVNGTAVAGRDDVAARGIVTIPAVQLTATVTGSVIGDRVHERNETFRAVLTRPTGATLGTSRATVTALNDD